MSVLLSIAIIFFALPQNPYSYHRGIKTKMERLQTLESPKIILIGGSNLAFGMDTKRLEKVFKRPAVNMGLHASLGLSIMFEQVKPYVNKGDIVIVSPEYQQFVRNQYYGTKILAQFLFENHDQFQYLTTHNFLVFLRNFLEPFRERLYFTLRTYSKGKSIFNEGRTVYDAENFNKHGDMIGHINHKNKRPLNNSGNLWKSTFLDKDIISKMATNIQKIEDRGGYVYLTLPCLPDDEYSTNMDFTNKVLEYYSEFSNIRLISSVNNYHLEEDNFFDTIYHLNREGIKLRTNLLISDLKGVLE